MLRLAACVFPHALAAVSENVDNTRQNVLQIRAELCCQVMQRELPFREMHPMSSEQLRLARLPTEFKLKKAGPQRHSTVGSVERGVRELRGDRGISFGVEESRC